MVEDNLILGVCGSPRARFRDTDYAKEIIKRIQKYQDLYSTIYDLAAHKRIANSEALMWMALFGAAKEGANVDILLLNKIYGTENTINSDMMNDVKNRFKRAKGIILSTPVYFGDCSSWMNHFLEDFSMKDKVVGVISVGAKRNGGQETTNIFTLIEAMNQGAVIVGNGPPTSQYGGTGWAGDVGAILDDNFGLDTSLGTGKRIMEVIKQMELPQAETAKITILTNSLHKEDSMIKEIENEFKNSNNLNSETIKIHGSEIFPCKACSLCPKPRDQNAGYGCVVEDDMRRIDEILLSSDGLAFVIEDRPENESFWSGFKVFSERTRHIRRDHFRLADIPVIIFYQKDLQKNRLLDVKSTTYMLRQNSIICGPIITRSYLNEKLIYENIPLTEACNTFAKQARRRKYIVITKKKNDYAYSPIGYEINGIENR